MTYIIICTVVLLIAILVFVKKPFSLEQTLTIQTDAETLYQKVLDFKSWKDWSPWLLHEPNCSLVFSDNITQVYGHYTWDGKYIGSGKLVHTNFKENESIEQDIFFYKPYKSQGKVGWKFKPNTSQKGATDVTWSMQSNMPLLMSFMIPMIKKMVGNDYLVGLKLLAQQVGDNSKPFNIEMNGEVNNPAITAIKLDYKGKFVDMADAMQSGYSKLAAQAQQNNLTINSLLCAYDKVNIKKMTTECRMLAAVDDASKTSESELGFSSVPAGKFYSYTITGSYDNLESAWHIAMSNVRMLKLKLNTKLPSLEIYDNDPTETAPEQLITRILVPVV